MEYTLKYANLFEITYKDNKPRGVKPAGSDAGIFESENKAVISGILNSADEFTVAVDASTVIEKDREGDLTYNDASFNDGRTERISAAIKLAMQSLREETSWLYTDFFLEMKKEQPELTLADFAYNLFLNLIDQTKIGGFFASSDRAEFIKRVTSAPEFVQELEEDPDSLYQFFCDTDISIIKKESILPEGECFFYEMMQEDEGINNGSRLVAKKRGSYFNFTVIPEIDWLIRRRRSRMIHSQLPLKYPAGAELQYCDIKYAFDYILPSFYFSSTYINLDNIEDEMILNPFYYIWDLA